MTKEEILAYLKSKQQFLYDNFGIKFIGLFGSFSRDEAKDSSDIDILYHLEENKLAVIPKIFHFIWLGSNLPEKVIFCINSWQKLHPEFEIRICGNTVSPLLSIVMS